MSGGETQKQVHLSNGNKHKTLQNQELKIASRTDFKIVLFIIKTLKICLSVIIFAHEVIQSDQKSQK